MIARPPPINNTESPNPWEPTLASGCELFDVAHEPVLCPQDCTLFKNVHEPVLSVPDCALINLPDEPLARVLPPRVREPGNPARHVVLSACSNVGRTIPAPPLPPQRTTLAGGSMLLDSQLAPPKPGLTLGGPLLADFDPVSDTDITDVIVDVDCYVPSDYNTRAVVHSHISAGLATFNEQLEPVTLGATPHRYASTKVAVWPTLVYPLWVSNPLYAHLYTTVISTGLPNYLGARLPVPSGLNIPRWRHLLANYHDTLLCDYLEFGWPVGYTAPYPPVSVGVNHKSAEDYPVQVREYIDKELSLGGIIGPFHAPPFAPWTYLSPLLTQPKRDSLDRRVILDLSYPEGGRTVNAGITKNCLDGLPHSYTLPTVEDLATYVRLMGQSSYLWKSDLSRAYKQVRADPGDIPLLGFTFQGATYLDVTPSFGARLSAGACQRTTSAVCYLMRKMGFTVLVYLDDFCGIEKTLDKANQAYAAFLTLTGDLGLALAPAKCSPPTLSLEWLGFLIDTDSMIVSVPSAKLEDVLSECRPWAHKVTATRKEIQSLVGKLVHISRCLPHARRFICRILATLRKAPDTGRVPLSTSFKADVRWFQKYAEYSNGVRLIDPDLLEYNIECDSSLTGGGGNTATHFYEIVYDAEHRRTCTHITQSEAVNIVTAYRTLTPSSTLGMRIVIYTDSMSSKYALQTGRTKDYVLAACSRQMWLEAALRDQCVTVRHKPGKDIPLADALSRSHDPAKRALASALVEKRGLTRLFPLRPTPFFSRI